MCENKTGVERILIFVLKIDLCLATSMEISCRDFLNHMAEHRSIFSNTYHSRFIFTSEKGNELLNKDVPFLRVSSRNTEALFY